MIWENNPTRGMNIQCAAFQYKVINNGNNDNIQINSVSIKSDSNGN